MIGRIVADDVTKVCITCSTNEREALPPEHPASLHPDLVAVYKKLGYDRVRARTRAEAETSGEGRYNEPSISITHMALKNANGGTVVHVELSITPYLYCSAMGKLAMEHATFSADDIALRSPRMTNVSILAPVRKHARFVLVSQIKGKAIGSGAVYPAIVAGGVDAADLQCIDPLQAALGREAEEEMQTPAHEFDPTPPRLLSDEVGGEKY